jgi:xylulokinase
MIYTKKDKKVSYILAIDLGSTNLKAAVFNNNLDRIGESIVTLPYLSKEIKKYEFDVDTSWNLILMLIKNVCRKSGLKTGYIDTISVDSQNTTFTVLNELGKPLMPFISWIDSRAESESKILNRKFGSDLCRQSGLPHIGPFSDISKFLWIKKNIPDILSGENKIYFFSSYAAYKLAGTNVIDTNLAAMHNLYSTKTGNWRSDMMDFIGIKRSQLPVIVDTESPVKILKLTGEINLKPDLEVVLSGNDQTAAAIGNLVSNGRILIGLGTALMVYRYMGDREGPYNKNSLWGPYPGGGYYEIYANNYGTRSLDWANNILAPDKNAVEFSSIARLAEGRKPGDRAILFYPQRMKKENAWVGEGDLRERALAVFEGISFYIRYIISEYLKININLKPIFITGGGSNNILWLKLISDILNTRVYKAGGDALLGSAIMVFPEKRINRSKEEKAIEPDRDRVLFYGRLYRAWVNGLKKPDYV